MIERFTRVDANNLRREITFDDPKTWTKPWTVLIEMGRARDGRHMIFDSACHEGNYGMTGILVGARKDRAGGRRRSNTSIGSRDCSYSYSCFLSAAASRR